MFDQSNLISDLARGAQGSGIRSIAMKADKRPSIINLSVGQPDFDVPDGVKEALSTAMHSKKNGYVPSGGIFPLVALLQRSFAEEYPKWNFSGGENAVTVTCGVTTAIYFALKALINPGDEIIIGDPEFLHYTEIVHQLGGKSIRVSTYPDFELTAERTRPYINKKTKAIIFSSPGNPSGAVTSEDECKKLCELAEEASILLIADEIYKDFYYGEGRCPSVATYSNRALVLRGLSKSHGMPGWRIGFAFGTAAIVDCITRLQGLCIVSAPSIAQHAALKAFDCDVSANRTEYAARSIAVAKALGSDFKCASAQGGFYYFVEVPAHLGMSAASFCEAAIDYNVLVIPGSVFSSRDTHFRLALTSPRPRLLEAVDALKRLVRDRGTANAA